MWMIYWWGYELEGPISGAMCLIIGISYQGYIILDNCDGKQARRTGSSSPMGMLFDHGCDAFVAMFNSYLLMRMFSIGTDPY
jgi:ethanolaminephosphotransferase